MDQLATDQDDCQQMEIGAGHPCLAGHFPARPVVPAVVVLDHVRLTIEATYPDARLGAIEHCKFLIPVLPDQTFSIELAPVVETMVEFRCVTLDKRDLLVKGRARLDVAS
jgi:3-hydroxymyristoyl/3-hydroxydecanoyl-(acyl carrier protein) dehydratase